VSSFVHSRSSIASLWRELARPQSGVKLR
jgi:hypothetical protein